MISIVLVDDQKTVRQGLRMWLELEPDLEILGEAEDGQAALEVVSQFKPDIVLMDAMMPRMDGISATSTLQHLAPKSAVVMLSLRGDPDLRARAREAGAVAFIEKHEGEAKLLAVIRQIARPSATERGT